MAYDFTKFKKQISGAEEWLKKEFSGIRTGQATPALLDGVKVDSYGTLMAIPQVAAVTGEGPRTLRVVPWDTTLMKEIEKAITVANLGVSVGIDEKGLRVNFPELTSESRTAITRLAKDRLEEAKKQIRMHRDDAMKDLQAREKAGGIGKDEVFRHQKEIQKMVDTANTALEANYIKKEKEILS